MLKSFLLPTLSWFCESADSTLLPLQPDTVTFACNLQSHTATAKWLLLVAFVPGLPARPASGPGSLMCCHVSAWYMFTLSLHFLVLVCEHAIYSMFLSFRRAVRMFNDRVADVVVGPIWEVAQDGRWRVANHTNASSRSDP